MEAGPRKRRPHLEIHGSGAMSPCRCSHRRRRPRSTSAMASVRTAVVVVAATTTMLSATTEASNVVQQKLYGLPTGLAYYVEVNVGSSSAKPFNLLIDTGSSNTAVATADCCSSTSTSLYSCAASSSCVSQSREISVSYITGSWSGQLVTDTFTSSEIGSVASVPFTEILEESSFIQSGYDGIIGLAYPSIGSPEGAVPTPYFETMQTAKALPNMFSMLMCGSLQALLVNNTMSYEDDLYSGELILGATSGMNGEVYYKDELVYTPLVQERWFNVLTTAITIGGKKLDVSCKDINTPRTIIDSGTSNMAFPSSVYTAIINELRVQVQKVIPGLGDAFFSDSVPCCSSYCDPTNENATIFDLPAMEISLALDATATSGGSDQQITVSIPAEYLWRPIMLATNFGVQKCRVFGISEGDLTLLGDVFMDGLFTVHDRDNKRLGLGVATSCPNGVVSTKTIKVETLTQSSTSSSYCDCMSSADRKGSVLSALLPFTGKPCFFVLWWMYLVAASALLIVISTGVICYVCCQRRKYRRAAQRSRLLRQQSNALGRNLLTPPCDAGTPPAAASAGGGRRPVTQQPRPSGLRPSSHATASSLSSSSGGTTRRSSDVQIEMRQLPR